jgi:hypothetical protein
MATGFTYIPATQDGCTQLTLPEAAPAWLDAIAALDEFTADWPVICPACGAEGKAPCADGCALAPDADWHPCSHCGPDASHEDRNCAAQDHEEVVFYDAFL